MECFPGSEMLSKAIKSFSDNKMLSGLWIRAESFLFPLNKKSLSDPFTSVTPTDFSMYDPSDLEHVGWYYIPVQNGMLLFLTIGQTAKLDLTSSDSGQGLMEQKDEIGQMANGVLMRSLPDPARCARLMSRATGSFRMREKQSGSSSGSPVSSAGESSRAGDRIGTEDWIRTEDRIRTGTVQNRLGSVVP